MADLSVKRQAHITTNTRRWLFLILALYLILAVGYSVVTPLFEAPDEHHHFFNALAIRETGQLPRVDEDPGLARQEAAQPPLYYLLAAVLLAPVDVGNAADALWVNPYVQLGNANSPDNNNAFIHTQAEAFPWRGVALAGHLLRLLSVFLGLGTLIFLFGTARLIWPENPQNALLATALVAFLPQFGFLHGSITNDTLMIFLATAVSYQLLFLLRRTISNRRLLLLGVTLGLGLLAKTTGILLLIWAVGWLVLLISKREQRLAWQPGVLVLLPALLVGGWWLARNWLLYGDVTAANQFVALAGGNRHYSLGQVWGELDRVWLSAIAFFGWMTVRPPVWVQWLWGGIVGLSVGGAAVQRRRTKDLRKTADIQKMIEGQVSGNPIPETRIADWQLWLVVGSWLGLVFLGWTQFMRQTSAEQGRLFFPALAAVALLLVAGLTGWRNKRLFVGVAGVALLTTLYALFVVLPAAYAIPQPLMETAVSANPVQNTRIDQPLGQGVELLAAHIDTTATHPGDFVKLTFYWRADEIPSEPPTIVVDLFGREQALVGKLHTYHGNGRFPASLWQPQTIYKDTAWVRLASDMVTPTIVRPVVHLLDGDASVGLMPIRVTAEEQPAPQTAVATLGDSIEIVGVEVDGETAVSGDPIQIQVSWQANAPVPQSLTTFVHMGEQTQAPLAQADGLPLRGDYPTQYWDEGDQIIDAYTLILPPDTPPGEYPIYIGLYDPATGMRLPVSIDNQPQPFSAYLVGSIQVVAE